MKQLHKVREGQPISARAYNDLIDAINEMRIIASDDILPKQQAGGQSLFIRPQVARGRSGGVATTLMPVGISGSTLSSTSGCWEYTWSQARFGGLAGGYDSYVVDDPAPLTGIAYNYAEYHFPPSAAARDFLPVPVENGALVWLSRDSLGQYWFDRDVSSEHGDAPSGAVMLGTSDTVVSSILDKTTYAIEEDRGYGCTKLELTGVYYNTSAHKFFVKYRECKYDGGGRFHHGSAEAAAEIVELVECEPEEA